MEQFTLMVSMAILAEGVYTYFTELKKEFSLGLVIPMVICLAISIGYNIDLPAGLGISAQVPYLGNVLTGLIMARGSNYFYDTIGKLTSGGK